MIQRLGATVAIGTSRSYIPLAPRAIRSRVEDGGNVRWYPRHSFSGCIFRESTSRGSGDGGCLRRQQRCVDFCEPQFLKAGICRVWRLGPRLPAPYGSGRVASAAGCSVSKISVVHPI